MRVVVFDRLDSTQKYLINLIKDMDKPKEIAVVAKEQTNGIGSLNRDWQSLNGNLFLSFVLLNSSLPKDLPIQSASIYFAYILKESLFELGACVWLKWPNDLYIDNKKVGGIITAKKNSCIICGAGLNTANTTKEFAKLDRNIDNMKIIKYFINKVKKKYKWKDIFRKYKVEFYNNIDRLKYLRIGGELLADSEVVLNVDGSIDIDKKRIYSLR